MPEGAEEPPNIPLLITLDVLLLLGAALFAGLTLSVMGLDTLSLEIIATSGKDPDRIYANALLPVRKMGNRLLCTLIFGNVMVNTLIAQITDRFITGAAGTALSTALITLGGEIIPQASMAAHALQVGATSVPICKFFLVVFYPICGPLAWLLDKFVGTDPGQIYDRNELRKLMAMHASAHFSSTSGLGEQDLNVMLGAMDLHDKTVDEAMTPLGEVYMIEAHEILTDQLIHEIWESGHSRVPVFRGNRGNIIGLLFAKDLLLTRTDERTTVLDLIRFYPRTALSVMADTKLIVVLQEFRTGRSHLATVKQVTIVGGGDPHYETVGIVTMEDVVEELIRANIEDEYDVKNKQQNGNNNNNNCNSSGELTMSPSKAFQMKKKTMLNSGSSLLEQRWGGLTKECIRAMRKTTLEESHARVASLFLVESVAPFTGRDPVLVRSLFIHRDHVFRIKAPLRARQLPWDSRSNLWLFRKGIPTNFMVLVIAGSVEVFMDDPSNVNNSNKHNNFGDAAGSDTAGSGSFSPATNTNNYQQQQQQPNSRYQNNNDDDDEEMSEDFGTPKHASNGGGGNNNLMPSSALPIMEMGQWTVLGSSVIGHPKGIVVPDFSARVVSNAVLLLINAQQFRDAFSNNNASASATSSQQQQQQQQMMSSRGRSPTTVQPRMAREHFVGSTTADTTTTTTSSNNNVTGRSPLVMHRRQGSNSQQQQQRQQQQQISPSRVRGSGSSLDDLGRRQSQQQQQQQQQPRLSSTHSNSDDVGATPVSKQETTHGFSSDE